MPKELPENLYFERILKVVVSTRNPNDYENLKWMIEEYSGTLISVNPVTPGYPELEVNIGFQNAQDAREFKAVADGMFIRIYTK